MKNLVVRKSNDLVEASYKLSTAEQRVILFLISMIQPNDKDFREYVLPIKEFIEMAGLQHKGEYGEIKEITKRLLGRVLEITTPTGLLQVAWLSSAEYQDGAGRVILNFDKKLKPYLLQLQDRFTKFGLYQVMRLKSSYSIRLYELLKQYTKLRERNFLIDDFRARMGIEKGLYKNFNDLKRNVILVAKKELAEQTDLAFDFEEIKIGRRVGKIRFKIKSKVLETAQMDEAEIIREVSVAKAVTHPESEEAKTLISLLPEQYQNKVSVTKLIKAYLVSHKFDYVMRNIIYSNDKSNALKLDSSNERSNYRVYLAKALNDDYGLAYYEDQLLKKEAEQVKQQTFVETEKQKQREIKQIDQERENRGKARVFIASYTAETLQQFEEEAKKRMSHESLQRYLRQDVIGNFEFKRRLEDVVMEHVGLKAKSETSSATQEPEKQLEAAS